MKKRVLSILLCLVMALALLPTSAFAAKARVTTSVNTSLNTSTYELTVTWDAVDGANKYYVYLLRNDGTGFYTQSGFARTINASAERKTVYGAAAFATPDVSGIDDWMVEVYAVNAVGEYIRSDKSNSFSVNMPKLTTPTPTLDSSGQASWSTISGANNYGFTLYGRSGSSGSGSQIITGSTNQTSTDLSGHMAEGYSYRIRVYAFDSTYTHINSDIAYSGWVAYKPAKAPTVSEVTSVAAVVTAPTAGKTPSEVKPILSTEDVTLYDYDWKDQNGNTLSKWYDTFESGKTYRLVVLASTTKKFASNATAAINGQAATVDNRSDSTLRFYFDFTLDTTIDTVNFKVTPFYVGDTPQDISVTSTGTQHFTVRGVRVTDDDDNTLASDHKFADKEKVYIYVDLEADDGYAFPSDYKNLNSYFSGEAGQEWPYTDVKNVTVYMAYRVGARPTISDVDVTLAEPVAGAKPSATAAATDSRYTVSRVVWYHLNENGTSGDELGPNETFEAGKGYTVMIVAKANMGYWFSVTSSTVNGKSATTAYTRDDTYACYYNFPAQQTKTLASIAITTPPTKTEYIVGNSFDATGMVVTATYSDGSSAPVTGFTISPNGSLTEGHKSVTVSYTENYITKTATQAITVKPATKTLESIAITKAPTKTEYRTGDTFDPAGMIVTATYTDKTTAAVTGYTFTPNGKLAANNTTITVSYTEGSVTKTATQAITVKQAKTPSSLAVTTAPAKTTYAAGEMFSSSGITYGTDDTHFSPNQTCSTAHIITFLYRTMGIGADGWYEVAEAWAKGAGLLDGIDLEISPSVNCPRADVVLYLYRELAK